jgi:hypothetical protein
MIISHAPPPTIPALEPEKRVEAVKVRPAIGGGLQDYLKQNPSGVPLGGPLGWVGAGAGLSLGAPVMVGRGLEFLPLFNPNSAADVMSAVSEAAESPSIGRMGDVVDKAMEFVEQFPELPHDLEITVHLVGLVRPVASAVTVLRRPGPKNKVEVNRAVVQCLAGLVRLVADLPGMESAKPYTNGLYLVLKMGEEFFVVPHTEVIPAGGAAEQLPARAKQAG